MQNVSMQLITWYDSVAFLGHKTTVARAYIPANMYDDLADQIHTPGSRLYNNPDRTTRYFMALINPDVPLDPSKATDGAAPNGVSLPGAVAGSGGDGDDGGLGGQSYENPQNGKPGSNREQEGPGGSGGTGGRVEGSNVGIGLGAVGGAALYSAAMFAVAKRFRQRRASRAAAAGGNEPEAAEAAAAPYRDSPHGSPVPTAWSRGAGGLSRGGSSAGTRRSEHSAGGGSARTGMISAPVMTENSLGWN